MGLAFGRAGSGPPLLLLHGLGHRRQAWDPVLGLLTPHREVITVDLPGHGASPPLRTGDGQNAVGALALVLAARGQAASATALSPAGFPNRRYQIAYARGFFEFAVATSSALRNAAPRLTRGTAGRALLF